MMFRGPSQARISGVRFKNIALHNKHPNGHWEVRDFRKLDAGTGGANQQE